MHKFCLNQFDYFSYFKTATLCIHSGIPPLNVQVDRAIGFLLLMHKFKAEDASAEKERGSVKKIKKLLLLRVVPRAVKPSPWMTREIPRSRW